MKQPNLLSIIPSIVGCITGSPILLPSTASVLFPGVFHSDDNNDFKSTSKQSGVSVTRVLQPLFPSVKCLVDPTLVLEEPTCTGRKTTMSDNPVNVVHIYIWIAYSSSASTFPYTLKKL